MSAEIEIYEDALYPFFGFFDRTGREKDWRSTLNNTVLVTDEEFAALKAAEVAFESWQTMLEEIAKRPKLMRNA